ncbi:Phosphatidylinositol-4-phosphate 5-kinase [Balamuthia mandrillaris]
MDNTQNKCVTVTQKRRAVLVDSDATSEPGCIMLSFPPDSPFLQYHGRYKHDDLASSFCSPFVLHGHGTMVWKNGDRYVGHWKNNQRHGIGEMTFSPSDPLGRYRYQGRWKADKMHHRSSSSFYHGSKEEVDGGIMEWKDGTKYIGEWKEGYRHGLGVQWFKDGRKYEGYWRKDREDGPGEKQEGEEGTIIKGEWKEGKLQSKAELLSLF